MAERTAPIAGQTDVASQVPSPPLPRDSSANATGAWGPLQVLTPGMTFREIGVTGLRAFGGWVREEFLPNLVGRQGAQKFREMRDNSPTIGGILSVIEATLRKVEWRVEPADDSAPAREMAEFVEQCMDDMCYDDQTEILTKRGWLLFAALADDDLVAQRADDGSLEC